MTPAPPPASLGRPVYPIRTRLTNLQQILLHTHEDLDTVVRGLTSAGFNRADIDLMASRDAILRKLKTMYRKPVEAAEIPGVPRRELVLPDDTVTTSAL